MCKSSPHQFSVPRNAALWLSPWKNIWGRNFPFEWSALNQGINLPARRGRGGKLLLNFNGNALHLGGITQFSCFCYEFWWVLINYTEGFLLNRKTWKASEALAKFQTEYFHWCFSINHHLILSRFLSHSVRLFDWKIAAFVSFIIHKSCVDSTHLASEFNHKMVLKALRCFTIIYISIWVIAWSYANVKRIRF